MERDEILEIEVPSLANDPNSLKCGPIQINDTWPGFYIRGIYAMDMASVLGKWIEEAKVSGKEIPPYVEVLVAGLKKCIVLE